MTHGVRARRTLHLTFDDGPHPAHTAELLDLLAEHGATATFFVIGEQAERHPDMMRRIVQGGHMLGNHSWSHPRFETLGLDAQREEIARTDKLLSDHDGRMRHDFRPPRGVLPRRRWAPRLATVGGEAARRGPARAGRPCAPRG